MSYFVAGILRIMILEASAALLVVDRLLAGGAASPRRARAIRWAYGVVAALAVLAFVNFGHLRGHGSLIHHWEQYHFYLGSKYLPEIGYFDIYRATLLADVENTWMLKGVSKTRDLTNFEEVSVQQALADGPRVRAAFSDARWEAFKKDWAELSRMPMAWTSALRDHGNSASPAWAALAYPIASLLPPTPAGMHAMAALDALLMVALFALVFRTFGLKAGCAALTVWSLVPFCFDYLFGSFLRWDWLFAVGLCFCLYRRERYLAAGAALGYAIASKLFPMFFAVALGFRALAETLRHRRIERRYLRFAAGAAAGLALSVTISSAVLGGPRIWVEYKKRIDVTRNEKFYSNQYSLRTVFLQVAETPLPAFLTGWMAPAEIKQGRSDVDIRDHRVSFLALQLLLTLMIAVALVRADDLTALAMGPFLVFIWLVVNAYYWNMLAWPALAWALRTGNEPGPATRPSLAGLLGIHGTLAFFYLYQHFNRGPAEGYFVGLMLLVVLVIWGSAEIWRNRQALHPRVILSP